MASRVEARIFWELKLCLYANYLSHTKNSRPLNQTRFNCEGIFMKWTLYQWASRPWQIFSLLKVSKIMKDWFFSKLSLGFYAKPSHLNEYSELPKSGLVWISNTPLHSGFWPITSPTEWNPDQFRYVCRCKFKTIISKKLTYFQKLTILISDV